MEAAIRTRLLATAGVTALVSQRVYCGSRPQGGAVPDIVINRVSGAPIYTDDGEAGLTNVRIQVDCYGTTYAAAKGVARAVQVSLSDFIGTAGATTFQNIMLDSERDFREGGSNTSEYLFSTQMDFIIWF
jgi:hypothetical protein